MVQMHNKKAPPTLIIAALLVVGACSRLSKQEITVAMVLKAKQPASISIKHLAVNLTGLSVAGISAHGRKEIATLELDSGKVVSINDELIKFKLKSTSFHWIEGYLQLAPRKNQPAISIEGKLAHNDQLTTFRAEIYEPIALEVFTSLKQLTSSGQEDALLTVHLPVDKWLNEIPASLWALATTSTTDSLILISPSSNKDLYLLLTANIKNTPVETSP